MKLRLSKFKRQNFAEYKSWFEDSDLNTHLGPLDEEWLTCVLQETDGYEYAVFRQTELVAVVGVKFPDADHPEYYLTDFAVNPTLRSISLGTEVLHALLRKLPLQPGQSWKTFVDVRNPRAKAFFEKNGWESSLLPDKNGMFTLELRTQFPSRGYHGCNNV